METTRFWRPILGCSLVFWMGAIGFAQDRVTFTPEGASKPLIDTGEILDLTGTELILRSGASPRRIPTDRIERIETQYHRDHLAGEEAFRQGETAKALSLLRAALDREPRAWVDREILALIVQADLRQQDLAGAIRDFRVILTTDPATRHWGIAPLIWSPQVVPDALRVELQKLLSTGTAGEQLIAGSLLLFDPLHGEEAERVLHSVSRNTNPMLSATARAQLWRLELASRTVHDVTLERWRDHLVRLPKELRPGPQYLYSRGYEVLGDLRMAAAEAMWLPTVYPDNEVLTARALLDAAENLSRTGLNRDAQTLYRELVTRYPWSRDAALARSRLEQIAPPPAEK